MRPRNEQGNVGALRQRTLARHGVPNTRSSPGQPLMDFTNAASSSWRATNTGAAKARFR